VIIVPANRRLFQSQSHEIESDQVCAVKVQAISLLKL